jgi:hypothetical protein
MWNCVLLRAVAVPRRTRYHAMGRSVVSLICSLSHHQSGLEHHDEAPPAKTSNVPRDRPKA